MERNKIILLTLLLAVACARPAQYRDKTYVYLESASLTVAEDAGSIRFPVCVSGADRDFMVAFTISDGTSARPAKAGEDYRVTGDAAGTLFFKAGETVQYIDIDIIGAPGVLTGNKDFHVTIRSASEGVALSGFTSCRVTIADGDHPLKDMLGAYRAVGSGGVSWTVTLLSDPDAAEDYYKVLIDGIVPPLAGKYVGEGIRWYVEAKVSENKSTITFTSGYKLRDKYQDVDIYIYGVMANDYLATGNVILTGGDGKYEYPNGFGAIIVEGGQYYLLSEDSIVHGPITLTQL